MKCKHEKFEERGMGEECLGCGLLRTTVEAIGETISKTQPSEEKYKPACKKCSEMHTGAIAISCICSEEKKGWKEDFEELFGEGGDQILLNYDTDGKEIVKSFISKAIASAKEEEREKWRLKNAGLYRQLFAEMDPERTFTAKEIWKMFAGYAPLFTGEQKKELKDNLYKEFMK